MVRLRYTSKKHQCRNS